MAWEMSGVFMDQRVFALERSFGEMWNFGCDNERIKKSLVRVTALSLDVVEGLQFENSRSVTTAEENNDWGRNSTRYLYPHCQFQHFPRSASSLHAFARNIRKHIS